MKGLKQPLATGNFLFSGRPVTTHCWHWDMDLRFPIPVIVKAATLTQAGAANYD